MKKYIKYILCCVCAIVAMHYLITIDFEHKVSYYNICYKTYSSISSIENITPNSLYSLLHMTSISCKTNLNPPLCECISGYSPIRWELIQIAIILCGLCYLAYFIYTCKYTYHQNIIYDPVPVIILLVETTEKCEKETVNI